MSGDICENAELVIQNSSNVSICGYCFLTSNVRQTKVILIILATASERKIHFKSYPFTRYYEMTEQTF